MVEQVRQPDGAGEGKIHIVAHAPFWKAIIQTVLRIGDGIAQRLEDLFELFRLTAAGQIGQMHLQGQGPLGKLRPLPAGSAHGRAVDPGQSCAQEGGGGIGAIVDIVEQTAAARFAPGQVDGIQVQQQGCGAFAALRPGIENIDPSKAHFEHLRPRRVLVQQIAQIRCRGLTICNGQKHGVHLPFLLPRRFFFHAAISASSSK